MNGLEKYRLGHDYHFYQMAKRAGLGPEEQAKVTYSFYHRPNTVIAVVRDPENKLPLGVGFARKNPKVKAEYINLERLALRRALGNALPLVRVL